MVLPEVSMNVRVMPGRNCLGFEMSGMLPKAAALSPSCPIAEPWGSGSMTAQTLTDRRELSTVTGRMNLRWGGARSARGRRTPPRHAQPGIHEYTAQTLAGG